MPGRERIVVGLDGSPHSKIALRWAHREALLRDAELEVAHFSSTEERATHELADLAQLEALVREVVGDDSTVPVQHRVVEGPPAPGLIEAAKDADLVVVGSHGHRAYGGIRLGSVSQQVADHASCPVVVVR